MLDVYKQASDENEADLHILHPGLYRQLFAKNVLETDVARLVLPKILPKMLLCRTIGSIMDVNDEESRLHGGGPIQQHRRSLQPTRIYDTVYGIVSSWEEWQFLRLQDKSLMISGTYSTLVKARRSEVCRFVDYLIS
jgi:hypothetical protein